MLHDRPLYSGTAPRPVRHDSFDRQNIETSELLTEEMQQPDGLANCSSGAMLMFLSNVHLELRLQRNNNHPLRAYAKCTVPGNLDGDAQREFSH